MSISELKNDVVIQMSIEVQAEKDWYFALEDLVTIYNNSEDEKRKLKEEEQRLLKEKEQK